MSRVTVIETHLTFKTALKPRQRTCRFTLHWQGPIPAGFDLSRLGAVMVHGWHLDRGWSGAGYHYILKADASIERCRPRWALGAHDSGENADSIGICVVYRESPTEGQIERLVALLADLCEIYGQSPDGYGVIDGHRDNEPPETPTECPGDGLYALLPEIRASVSRLCGY